MLDVRFESKGELKRREMRERGSETWGIRGQIDGLCSGTVTGAGLHADEDGGKMSDGVRGEMRRMRWIGEWEERAEVSLEGDLRDLREEMAEMSLRVERLERAMPWECDGSGSSSGGGEWAWWSGAWWVKTGVKMNLANRRRVHRAINQSLGRTRGSDGARKEKMSDTDQGVSELRGCAEDDIDQRKSRRTRNEQAKRRTGTAASTEGKTSKTGTRASNEGNVKETEKVAGAEGNVSNATGASVYVTHRLDCASNARIPRPRFVFHCPSQTRERLPAGWVGKLSRIRLGSWTTSFTRSSM